MKTKLDAISARLAIETLKPFIGRTQLLCLGELCCGEEKQHFFDKLYEYAERVTTMPKTYEQDGKGEQAIVSLHYFTSGCDWWITEKDMETVEEPGQHQAFGLADLGYGAELGYISIVELLANGAELDLYFRPCTIAELQSKRETPSAR